MQTTPPAEPKFALRSKTIIGIILVVLPVFAKFAGIALEDADAQAVAEPVVTLLGALIALWGRITAKAPLTLAPGAADKIAPAILATLLLGGCAGVPLPKICVTRGDVTVCAESDGTALTGSARYVSRDGKTVIEAQGKGPAK